MRIYWEALKSDLADLLGVGRATIVGKIRGGSVFVYSRGAESLIYALCHGYMGWLGSPKS